MYKVVEMGGSVASTNKCWAFAVSGSQDRDRHIIFIPHPSPIIQLGKKSNASCVRDFALPMDFPHDINQTA